MTVPDDAELRAMAEATATTLDLKIPDECWPGVLRNLAMILGHAETVAKIETDTPTTVEIAPVFRP